MITTMWLLTGCEGSGEDDTLLVAVPDASSNTAATHVVGATTVVPSHLGVRTRPFTSTTLQGWERKNRVFYVDMQVGWLREKGVCTCEQWSFVKGVQTLRGEGIQLVQTAKS